MLVAASRRDRGAGIMRHQYSRRRPSRAWEHPWDAGRDIAARACHRARPRCPRGLRPPAGRRSWRAVACPGRAGAVRQAPGRGGGCLAPGRPGGPWCARHLRDRTRPARGQPGGGDFLDGYPPAVRPAVLGVEESRRGAVPLHRADPAGAGGLRGRGVQRRLHDERSGRWLLHPGAGCRPAAAGGRLAGDLRQRERQRRRLGQRRGHDPGRGRRAPESRAARRRWPPDTARREPRLAGMGGDLRRDVVRGHGPRHRAPVALGRRGHRQRRARLRDRARPWIPSSWPGFWCGPGSSAACSSTSTRTGRSSSATLRGPRAGAPHPSNGSKLVPSTVQGPWTFFQPWWARDFITLSARPGG